MPTFQPTSTLSASLGEAAAVQLSDEERHEVDVLIVDDDDRVRALMADSVRRWGYSTRTAENGKLALLLLAQNRFRLIITDVFMPSADGLELLMQYGKVHPHAPVLVVSGGGNGQDPESIFRPARHMGCWRALAKPFELFELEAAVRQQLG